MNHIRKFILGQNQLKNPPQYYVLADGDGTVVCTADREDEDPAGQLESALKSDLAFVTGRRQYMLMGQDNAGAVMTTTKILVHGAAPKGADFENAASTVNGNLVNLVGKLSSTTVDHFEKLYNRQDEVIRSLLDSNKALAAAAVREEGGVNDPMRELAQRKAASITEIVLGAAMKKMGGGLGGNLPPGDHGPPRPATGKHAELRAFISSEMTDDEIDGIIAVILSTGSGDQILGVLSPENYAKALQIMGAQ